MNYSQEIERIEKEVITTIWVDSGGRHQEERINPCGDGGCENGDAIENLLTLAKKMQEELQSKKPIFIKNKVCEELIKFLQQPGSVCSVEQSWIPCSERLPEKEGWYLVTIGIKENAKVWKVFSPTKKDYKWKEEGIIAWMPLPEPFKE